MASDQNNGIVTFSDAVAFLMDAFLYSMALNFLFGGFAIAAVFTVYHSVTSLPLLVFLNQRHTHIFIRISLLSAHGLLSFAFVTIQPTILLFAMISGAAIGWINGPITREKE